jgi:hypothetical protein
MGSGQWNQADLMLGVKRGEKHLQQPGQEILLCTWGGGIERRRGQKQEEEKRGLADGSNRSSEK